MRSVPPPTDAPPAIVNENDAASNGASTRRYVTPPAGERISPFSGQALPVASGRLLEGKGVPQNAAASSVKFWVAPSLMAPDALVSSAVEKSLQESVNVAVAMNGAVLPVRADVVER